MNGKKCKAIMEYEKVTLKILSVAKKPAWKYKKWFIENADHFHFKDVNIELSQKLADEIDAKIKQCYHNSFLGMLTRIGYTYYEGFTWSKRIPLAIEHSWLVKDNKVVDPTLIINGEKLGNQIRKLMPSSNKKSASEAGTRAGARVGDEYMGVCIPNEFVRKLVLKNGYTGGVLFNYWRSLNDNS